MERINATTGSYNFIDLFAGAGGLSEGFIQAGFSPVAHVEMNPYAAQTLETRTGYYYLKAQGKLDIYKDYISGKITRDEFLQHIPEEQLQSVFCETMSNETLPRLFENIDGHLQNVPAQSTQAERSFLIPPVGWRNLYLKSLNFISEPRAVLMRNL